LWNRLTGAEGVECGRLVRRAPDHRHRVRYRARSGHSHAFLDIPKSGQSGRLDLEQKDLVARFAACSSREPQRAHYQRSSRAKLNETRLWVASLLSLNQSRECIRIVSKVIQYLTADRMRRLGCGTDIGVAGPQCSSQEVACEQHGENLNSNRSANAKAANTRSRRSYRMHCDPPELGPKVTNRCALHWLVSRNYPAGRQCQSLLARCSCVGV
jgi:hypothetical protein